MSKATNKDTSKPGDPGLSLWLVPPENKAIYDALKNAILHIVPPILGAADTAPRFEPHLTLASRIPRQSVTEDPQKWLDELELPPVSATEVQFQELAVGDAFFKKLFLRCKRTESLLRLASSCRAYSSAKIDEADYDPHVSILYSKDSVSEDDKRLIEHELAENNISVDGQTDCGWKGGSVWLVPTDGDVADWLPIARRS